MSLTKKEISVVFLLSLVLLFIVIVPFEIILALLRPSPDQRDELLGWRLKENYQRSFAQKTLAGKEYEVSFSTNGMGLRIFGSNDKAPIKILVLGDSFTADPYASNDRMWYAKMTERLATHARRPLSDFYVMAGGAGGWGTYQEFILSESLSRAVHPNLFVLQFCSNDFQNNSYEWEQNSVVRGQYMRRPYAAQDFGQPKYSADPMALIYRSFVGESRLFSRIDALIGTIQFKQYGGYNRPLPPDVMREYEQVSVLLTKTLLTKLRELYRDIPAVMLNCDGNESGPNKYWKSIAGDAGFVPLSRPSDFMRSMKPDERAKYLHADGSHLSEEGNQAYGAVAGDELFSLNLASLSAP